MHSSLSVSLCPYACFATAMDESILNSAASHQPGLWRSLPLSTWTTCGTFVCFLFAQTLYYFDNRPGSVWEKRATWDRILRNYEGLSINIQEYYKTQASLSVIPPQNVNFVNVKDFQWTLREMETPTHHRFSCASMWLWTNPSPDSSHLSLSLWKFYDIVVSKGETRRYAVEVQAFVNLKGKSIFKWKGHLSIFSTPILVHIWNDLKGQLKD
jgi:hypothetical protein